MAVKKIALEKIVSYLKKPWVPAVLAKVEDYDIKLLKVKDKYFWHRHDKHDEFMLVYEGKLIIQLEGNKEITMNKGEGILIEKGTLHCSKSTRGALVLVVERDTILSDFVKPQ
jgi:mannose-6-phosphate isomerase-like protein (cupin superfamily)